MRIWFLPGYGLKRWIGVIVLGGFISGLSLGIWSEPPHSLMLLLIGFFLTALGIYRLVLSIDRVLRRGGATLTDLYKDVERGQGPKVVAIGGGTGLSTLLKGLKKYTLNITAVVAVSDEGGSTGRIRRDWGGVAIGDIRNCVLALAEEGNFWASVLRYRFSRGELKGHSLGNLLLLALSEIEGDFLRAINKFRKMIGVEAEVLPVTLSDIRLRAVFEDGSSVDGEVALSKMGKRIVKLEVIPSDVSPLPEVVEAIRRADLIAIGPGSLYTSIIPNFLFEEVVEALKGSRALKVYICNIMTQPGETDGFTALDHLREVEKYLGKGVIDYIIVNTGEISKEVLERYRADGAEPVKVDLPLAQDSPGVIRGDFVFEKGGKVRHHSYKLADALVSLLKRGERDVSLSLS